VETPLLDALGRGDQPVPEAEADVADYQHAQEHGQQLLAGEDGQDDNEPNFDVQGDMEALCDEENVFVDAETWLSEVLDMGNRFSFLLEFSDEGGAVFVLPAYVFDGVQVPLLGHEAAAHAAVADREAEIAAGQRHARPHPVGVHAARLNPFCFVTVRTIAFGEGLFNTAADRRPGAQRCCTVWWS
jgi:sirohydrochlorin ferrochelatase